MTGEAQVIAHVYAGENAELPVPVPGAPKPEWHPTLGLDDPLLLLSIELTRLYDTIEQHLRERAAGWSIRDAANDRMRHLATGAVGDVCWPINQSTNRSTNRQPSIWQQVAP